MQGAKSDQLCILFKEREGPQGPPRKVNLASINVVINGVFEASEASWTHNHWYSSIEI